MSKEAKKDAYALEAGTVKTAFIAPDLDYRPRDPKTYRPAIGMIACGGITKTHLTAYKKAGYNVVALCDRIEERALTRQEEFFPDAFVTTDYRDVLARPDIEVVDIATHPQDRVPLIEAALRAKKHVLSQKPFVLDLDTGERLVRLADENGVKLAVNQNGRWAPYFAYIREAVKTGLLGDLVSVHTGVHWDHTWVRGTPFENIYDLIFYDFAIHWFDFFNSVLPAGQEPTFVSAMRGRAVGQDLMPPMLAQAIIGFEGGQGSLAFDAHVKYGPLTWAYVAGTEGTLHSAGPDLSHQTVTFTTEAGSATPRLEGNWFPDGFHGTMGELLTAIEQGREPENSARNNLRGLALCYAAIESANENGAPKRVGSVRRLWEGSTPSALPVTALRK